MARAAAAATMAALNGLDGTGSTNVIPFVSLHTSDPGTTGTPGENANAGGYARQACSWNAATSTAGGTKTNATSLTFATSGTVAVGYFGTWSASGYGLGTYAIGGQLTPSAVTAASIIIASGAISITAA